MNILDVRNVLNVTGSTQGMKSSTPEMTSYSTGITVDDELSPTSKNPVQNKVVYAALQEKQDLLPEGDAGKYLQKTADGVQWSAVDTLPSQTGNNGKFLTTNGTTASWATVDSLPSQTSQSGKFLTTNGTTASWDNIPTEIPSQSGNSGKFLTTNGTTVSWATVQAGGGAPTLTWYTGNTGTTVTIADTSGASLVKIYKNGILLEPTADYSISGTTLTMVTALVSTDKVTTEVF